MPEPAFGERVVTPEAVAVSIDVAGLGSRMIAAVIDTAIQALIGFLLGMAFAGIGAGFGGGGLTIGLLIVLFLLIWGYYPLFEGIWHGVTPGKRTQRLRVVLADGQPVTLGPVLIRNVVRIVDFIPGGYGIGVIAMLLTRRFQRLGDLAAGTIVVRDRRAPEPRELMLFPSETRAEASRRIDTTGLRERDYEVVRSFLERRVGLDPGARATLAHDLAEALRPRVGAAASDLHDDEAFLEAAAQAYRNRFASGSPPPPSG